MSVTGTVGVRIAVNDVALASVETSAVNGDITSRECVSAGVGNYRHGDAVGGDSGQAVDTGLTVGGSNGKILRHDMIGIGPAVCSVIDHIAESIDGIAAIAAVSEGGIS